ncbi:hypothetical protein VaNZ11_010674 [Volvox africanus]|uniref:Testis-expressed sequence 9 protein n=1 Tax=Volvox africanus TaxID=51714 RepID=A0ABQ5SB92_9CHLO|nr:hypothetical protein VaNZ11_010674 [Volvox africanus]
MSNFSYGAAIQQEAYGASGNEDNVLQRSSDEDLDDMVQRNIRDVLRQASVDKDGDAYGEMSQRQHDMGCKESTHQSQVDDRNLQILGHGGGPEDYGYAAAHGTRQAGNRHPGGEGRKSLTGSASGCKLRSQDLPGGSSATATVPHTAARRSGDLPNANIGAVSASLLDVPGQPEVSLRLHKVRIKTLEEDLSRANRLLVDREKQLTEALRELKELRGQAALWAREKKALEGQLDRAKKQAAEAESALRSTESQVRELAKSDSRAERERRASEAEVRARDVRLQRALEEVERFKQLLSDVRYQEREAKGSAQQDTARLLAENRKLERQRAELISAFKKQLKLIEVLKRQKVHLEAARALQFSEEEFMKTLEMGGA